MALSLLVAMGVTAAVTGNGQPRRPMFTLVGYGSSEANPQTAPGATLAPGAVSGASTRTFQISGNVAGLYPGATLPLPLTIANKKNAALTVSSITTTVGNASTLCGAGNVTVTTFTGALSVPAKGTATAIVHVSMLHGAPDACQGATFPLTYAGLATQQ